MKKNCKPIYQLALFHSAHELVLAALEQSEHQRLSRRLRRRQVVLKHKKFCSFSVPQLFVLSLVTSYLCLS